MSDDTDEPDSPDPVPSPWARPAEGGALACAGGIRHDGWTGERMARFCEALADTGLVVDACLAVGKSTNTAYATRRRDPVFAAAWEAALTIARERLADSLLARSIEGSVEQYFKDGVLVGEKRVIDNRLGLAILRRLDRLAETGTPLSTRDRAQTRPASPAYPERNRGTPSSAIDWDLALSAMRSGEPEALAEALAMLRGESTEAHETHDPPNSLNAGGEEADDDDYDDEPGDPADRCWQEDDDNEKYWMTTYPPPDGFTGYQRGRWGDEDYERACSPEESALLDRTADADLSEYRAEDAALRDAWFARLEAELALPAP